MVGPTNAYGEIEFFGSAGSGQGQQKPRKYVRADYKTSPRVLMELIQKQWNLSQPKLLISVTGGSHNFPLSSSLKDVFRKGLIKAALSTGAWIITGGSYRGVMKYVGEAVRDYAMTEDGSATTNIVAIGIATWGILDQQDALINKDEQCPAIYRMEDRKTAKVRLDPNHTHFILVDDGTTNNEFGVEIELRSALEKQISNQKVIRDSEKKLRVPTVCIVVQGGPNTIANVYEAVKNGTPCLIIAGSGRAADILAYAFEKARPPRPVKKKTYTFSEDVQVKIAEMLFKEFKHKDLDLHQQRIRECIQHPHLINVYKLDARQGPSTDIDRAILHALLRANKGNTIDQLQLALVWNRVDVAKREIFTDEKDWKRGELDASVRYAIEHDLPSFLELFIENGVSMNDYLTKRELTILYSRIEQLSLLSDLLKENNSDGDGRMSLDRIGLIIRQLTMDTYQPLYLSDLRYAQTYSLSDAAESSPRPTIPKQEHGDSSTPQFNPTRELFLYAILLNRKEMARLMWERNDESKIAAALTASKILKAMASKEDNFDLKRNMKEHAMIYEDLAIGILHECFNHGEDYTHQIMIRERPNWGYSTCLTMAVQAQNQKFISQSPVQQLLTKIWMGKISDQNSYWKLWLYTFFPPAVALGVWFKEDEHLKEKAQHHAVTAREEEGESHEMVVKVDKGSAVKKTLFGNERTDESYKEPEDIDIRDSGRRLSRWQRIKLFYNAPTIKYRFNVLAYFAFLFLFSFIILTEFDNEVMWKEWFLIAWVVTLFVEEFRQIAYSESKSWTYKFLYWITDFWNTVTVATLLLFGVGVVLRCFPERIGAARVILALDLMGFYMRLLEGFLISKNLGSKPIMIAAMMVDLLFFVCILAVFLISYGIASQAIMYPNETDPLRLFQGIFYRSYFQMYGELFLETIEGDGCSDNVTAVELGLADPCPEYSWMGILLLSVYMMLSNVLLLNLLIALFSYTIHKARDSTDEYLMIELYEVIKNYLNRPPFPPPLIIIPLVIRFCITKCCRPCHGWSAPKLKQHLEGPEVKQLILWERNIAKSFIAKEKVKSQHNLDERLKVTGHSVQKVSKMVESMLGDGDRLSKIEAQMARTNEAIARTNEAMEWIMQSLEERNLSSKTERPDLRRAESSLDSDEEADSDEVPTTIHTKSRKSPYPGTAMRRFQVPNRKVPWGVSFDAYQPVNYTAPVVLEIPHWADVDLMSLSKGERPALMYNQEDTQCNYNRRSHMGAYQVKDGLPMNPKGRTGVIGRGILGRFGPNHAADPIVTRWKRGPGGGKEMEGDKPILEFIAIQRRDNQQWAIPGGMVEPGHEVSQTLLREFSEEALGELDKTEDERKRIEATVARLFEHGSEVYKGYVDDPRNTDNAWMETVAMNFHDGDGSVFSELEALFQAGDDAQGVRWQRVSSEIPLFASHTAMLAKVAGTHNAAF